MNWFEVMARTVVMKFGGTSVQDAESFGRLISIVESQPKVLPVVVVSAMAGVTNALVEAIKTAAEGKAEKALAPLEEHFSRHIEVSRHFTGKEAQQQFEQYLGLIKAEVRLVLFSIAGQNGASGVLNDAVLACGERLSAALLCEVLNSKGLHAAFVDARKFIITDSEHGRANPDFEKTNELARKELLPILEDGRIPVLGGFIAASPDGTTTTLGRGGSDYTAAIVAAPIEAKEIQIWTDVTGVLTADPRIVSRPRTIPRLSYSEAAELAYFGAKVLHPKTIQPAVQDRIPVRICNSRKPEEVGTIVFSESESSMQTVKAIAHKSGVTTVQIISGRMLGAYGFLRRIFEIFDKYRTVVDVVTTSEVSVSLSLDDTTSLNGIVAELSEIGDVIVERGMAIVCVVGEGIRTTPGIAGRVFSTLGDINVSLISQGASRINLTFSVREERVKETVNRLHEEFFGS